MCTVNDCLAPIYVRGWCKKHYDRWWRTGDPNRLNTRNAYIPVCDEPTLRRMYVEENMTISEIAAALDTSVGRVFSTLKKCGIPRRKPTSRKNLGAKHGSWKGESAGYTALHDRVKRARGTPSECKRCGVTDPSMVYEWANLTGDYGSVNDYERMCVKCHRNYDFTEEKRLRLLKMSATSHAVRSREAATRTVCRRGHELTEETTFYRRGSSARECKVCRRALEARIRERRRSRKARP